MEQLLGKLAEKSNGKEGQGFPLIEVMVVVSCIGVLVTIALQKFFAH